MEDSFRVRVDRAFGSLQSSSSPSSSNNVNLASLWSLTDDEIEKREWNRDKRCSDDEDQPVIVPSPYTTQPSFTLEADIQDLLDESDEEDYRNHTADELLPNSSSRLLEQPDDHNNQDEWDVRASVGLDSTLDLEDEEDAYDQVAIGEEAGDLYRKDITDYEADMEASHVLPNTFRDVRKDPRANRLAAQIRLKEDAEAAKNLKEKLEEGGDVKSVLMKRDDQSVAMNLDEKMEADDLKSILIERDDKLVTKLEKPVPFEPGFNNDNGQGSISRSNITSMGALVSPTVPDYVRNPSIYTHYTFDSLTDDSEESNKKAYMDFFNLLKRQKNTETLDVEGRSLPKSVTFTPKKKAVDSSMKSWTFITEDKGDGNEEYTRVPLGIASEEAQDSETFAMEEDEPKLAGDGSVSLRKAGRRYRTRAAINLDKPVS